MIASAIREQLTALPPAQATAQLEVVAPGQADPTLVMPRPEAVLGTCPATSCPGRKRPTLMVSPTGTLQKGLQDVQHQVMGASIEEQPGIPFTEEVMADELPVNCRTPAIAEYDGTTDPQEHLSRFKNTALLHRYTNDIKC
ncbi:UNVERIFIED_CONTAM: hypothetical protein Sradi_6158000 [Sesamum radiatum]|uniref:Uncharacterized protein n=1 Tax=Sesamum radiatum TaxID=300843 RepID=A0AAW2K8C5_SESRA